MAWDPSLLRKYNTTGHFRLLNQLRGELKDQPIQRPLATSRPEVTSRRAVRRRDDSSSPVPAPVVRSAPVRGRQQSEPPAVSSFDPIVTVPVLIDAFHDQHL
jgi:hypothetical protein